MTLDQYLTATGISEATFGRLIDLSQPHVHRLRTGESWPSRDTALRIREVTSGAVSANDFLPPPEEPG